MENRLLNYIDVSADELRPNPWNSNRVSPENEAKIDRSLEELDWFKPLIARRVDGELEILGGEHRWKAAKAAGRRIPIIDLGEISDERAKTIALSDNARFGNDDPFELAAILDAIGSPEDIARILPYDHDQLLAIASNAAADYSNLDVPDEMQNTPNIPADVKVQTHATMKFKVRVEDQDRVMKRIKSIMQTQGFNADSAEVNAGDALTWLIFDYEGRGDE